MEELEGFAEEVNLNIKDIAFSWMSYLVPRCSGIAILGSLMKDGHTKLARNYEFSIEDEDLTVCQTRVKGKYAHIGGSIVGFGRTEGINECGLAVSMSSCGLPVSNIVGMPPAKIKGLQFWAVIKSLLDNCKDVEEALKLAMEMPIAYNINLYLADSKGNAVLLETINGHKAYEKIHEGSSKKYVFGTNHAVLEELKKYEPKVMKNSTVRYEKLNDFFRKKESFEELEIKDILLKKYPEGMSSYYYKQWFGTIKSVVMDTVEKRYSICWFGQQENNWQDYIVLGEMEEKEISKLVEFEEPQEEFFKLI